MAKKQFIVKPGDIASALRQATVYPPLGTVRGNSGIFASRELLGGLFNISTITLRAYFDWENDARLNACRIYFPTGTSVNNDNGRSLNMSWLNGWNFASNGEYYTDASPSDAFTGGLGTIVPNTAVALSGLGSVPRHGYGGLLLTISGGQPSGKNRFIIPVGTFPILEVVYTRALQPQVIAPLSGGFDATQTIAFQWVHSSGDDLDQGRFVLETSINGAAFTVRADQLTSNQFWIAPANTFTAGQTVQWRVTTYNTDDTTLPGPVSNTYTFLAGAAVATPNVTAPSGQIGAATPIVIWTSTQADRIAWHSRIRRVSNNVIVADSGEVAGQALTWPEQVVLTDLVNYSAETQVKSAGGIWSQYGTRAFNTAFHPPAKPLIALSFAPDSPYVLIGITNPAPAGGDDIALYNNIWRSDDNGLTFTLTKRAWPLNTPYKDFKAKSGIASQYFVQAVGTSTSVRNSDVSSVTYLIRKGFIITDVFDEEATALNVKVYRGGMGGQTDYDVEYAFVEGRKYAVALEDDEHESSGFDASFTMLNKGDNFNPINQYPLYRALIARRSIYCIRTMGTAGPGDKFIGKITSVPWQINGAMIHGYAVTLHLTVIDFTEGDF